MSGVHSWLDGVACTQLPASLRALQFGDGVFRTMRLHRGSVVLSDRQLERLCADAGRLGLACDRQGLARQLAGMAWPEADGIVKLCLLRGGSGRGYSPEIDADGRSPAYSLCFWQPWPDWPECWWRDGIDSALLQTRLALQPALAGIKHMNRLEQILASRELQGRGLVEGICLDTAGRLACGTRSNLFFWRDGRWHSPQLTACGVHGLTRERLLQLAAAQGMAPVVGDFDAEALNTAEALCFCNSLIGVLPVRQLDGRPLQLAPAQALADTLRQAERDAESSAQPG